MVDKEILELVAHRSIPVVKRNEELIRHMLAGDAPIQISLIRLTDPTRHCKRTLVALDKPTEIRFNEQHLLFRELRLDQGYPSLCKVPLRNEAGFLGQIVQRRSLIRIENIRDHAVGLDTRIELDRLQRLVDILMR